MCQLNRLEHRNFSFFTEQKSDWDLVCFLINTLIETRMGLLRQQMRKNRYVSSSVCLITLIEPISVVLVRNAMDVVVGEIPLKWP